MKKNTPLFICFVLLLQCFTVFAQKRFFIYIQAENQQQFYTVINNKTYGSTVSGYLVIPGLRPGKQFFSIGFIKEKSPQQKFICNIRSKDLGFLLKSFGEKGWGLFNLQDFSIIMANPEDWDIAKAENDKLPVKEEPEAHIVPAVYNEDSPVVIKTMQVLHEGEPQQNDSAKKEAAKPADGKSPVNKPETAIGKQLAAEGVYAAITSAVADSSTFWQDKQQKNKFKENKPSIGQEKIETTSVLNEKKEFANKYYATASATSFKTPIIKSFEQGNSAGVDLVYIDNTMATSADTVRIFIPYGFQPKVRNVLYNSGCVQLATEYDYNKLRRSMAEQTADNKMIDAAKKAFKARCFTTDQIKNLSLLFISDAGRYNFYSAAYSAAYDLVNYSSLEQNLHSEVYKQKFRLFLGY